MAPLVLLSGADFLSVFSKPQLDALALAFLRVRSNGTSVAMVFWALWLFPFGVLVIRSGFFPRILGVLLIVGCFAYLTVSITAIVCRRTAGLYPICDAVFRSRRAVDDHLASCQGSVGAASGHGGSASSLTGGAVAPDRNLYVSDGLIDS